MRLRNVAKMNVINDATHSRSLTDSIMMPEVISALRDLTKAGAGGVLVGAAALSFHVRPRMTQDLDFLFLDEADIPEAVPGFTRIARTLFQHDRTGVEVNVAAPAAIGVPAEVAEEVARTALVSNGVRVASEGGLVALKLFRLSYQDRADIIALMKTGRIALSGFPLAPEKLAAFQDLIEVAKSDPHPP